MKIFLRKKGKKSCVEKRFFFTLTQVTIDEKKNIFLFSKKKLTKNARRQTSFLPSGNVPEAPGRNKEYVSSTMDVNFAGAVPGRLDLCGD